MRTEALQGPATAARLLAADSADWLALGAELAAQPPQALLTVARGSSDHAAAYLAYLMTARLGRLVSSLPMSLITLYPPRLRCQGLLAMAFSQSGQSPDLVAPLQHIAAGGGRTLAFVNDSASPLAAAAQRVLALHAGAETSVAATKSCIAQFVTAARLVSVWAQAEALAGTETAANDDGFDNALQVLPAALQQATQTDWAPGLAPLAGAQRLYVIGRGTGLPVALELALKFKEVCGLQAEAFSGAEVQHGPMALVEDGFPVLVLAPRGPAQPGLLALATQLRERGAQLLLAAPAGTPGATLHIAASGHADLDPIALLQSFYLGVEGLARARGLDPDQPRHLSKVTRTR
jgi:glucosamine--fructose-6-phosphate aminotransferase (isomerizing)